MIRRPSQGNGNAQLVKEVQWCGLSAAATQVINGTLAFKLGSSEVATWSLGGKAAMNIVGCWSKSMGPQEPPKRL